jgi:hypothetical protein
LTFDFLHLASKTLSTRSSLNALPRKSYSLLARS